MRVLVIGLALILYGILAMYSVSIHASFSITLPGGDPSNYFFFFKHLKSLVMAVFVALAVYKVPISFFKRNKNIVIITILVFILQILVFVPHIGLKLNGARGWLHPDRINWFPTLQPCELFKLGYVFFMARWLIRKKKEITNDRQLLISYIVINVIFLIIFCFIPDFGSALVMGVTGLVMALYAGMGWKKVLVVMGIGIGGAILFGSVASMVSKKFAYIQMRMLDFTNLSSEDSSKGIGWQNAQALNAIGGGGLFGVGYGKGLQKFGYIPEAQSDFIFAAYSEEVGFVGDLILLALYLYLAYYVLTRLKKSNDEYNKVIAIGLLSLIILQAFINMGVNLRILPNTGLTLPFISHGGTALMANCISLILIYKIIENK